MHIVCLPAPDRQFVFAGRHLHRHCFCALSSQQQDLRLPNMVLRALEVC
jgi:hypothetical protein